jgi:putative membrane protein
VITNFGLATLNAMLNGTALVCVSCGAIAIKRRNILLHKRLMLTAFTLSLLFLTSYVTRMIMFGDNRFAGPESLRYVYYFILATHVVLAIAVAPFVVYAVSLGLRDYRERHRKLVRKVLPIWLYVLTTGVLVYVFLYWL